MDIKDIVKEATIIGSEATFREALLAMEHGHTNTLLVADENGELCGEVTVTDLLEAIIPDTLDGDQVMHKFDNDDGLKQAIKAALDTAVSDFMSLDFSALTLNDDMMNVMATAMTHQRARIPVVDQENRPIGIISRQGLKHIIRKFAGI